MLPRHPKSLKTYAVNSEEDKMHKRATTLPIKGNLLAVSKHADVSFLDTNGFGLYWFDTPEKGKCLSVECDYDNYSAVTVCIEANWRQKRYIAGCRKEGRKEETF